MRPFSRRHENAIEDEEMQIGLFEREKGRLDASEAPAGFYAVLKSAGKSADGGNICRACDLRSTCQKSDTDLTARGHRCMGYPGYGASVASPVTNEERNDHIAPVKYHAEIKANAAKYLAKLLKRDA